MALKEHTFTVDSKGDILPAKTKAKKGQRVVVTPIGVPFTGEVYAEKDGVDVCAELFGIAGLDHMTLSEPYTIATTAVPGIYFIVGSVDGHKTMTSTGELHVGSPGDDD